MNFSYNVLIKALEKDLGQHISNFDVLAPEATPKEFACFAQRHALLKKFKDVVSPDADQVALGKFLASNIRCSEWKLEVEDLRDELLVGTFREEMYRFFNPSGKPLLSDSYTILANGYTGPGASVGARGNDFYTKLFDSPVTTTSSSLYNQYVHYINNDSRWSTANTARADLHGSHTVVEGSRLSFVPKNETTSRVICTEPLLNMFYQLGVKEILEKRLRSFYHIDLRVQPDNNRELARIGSEYGQLCTIDLSSASDTISLRMIEEFLPHDVKWLKGLRSRKTQLPDGRWQELHMISSMGNGFTFPLETIIFSAVVSTCYHLLGLPKRHSPEKGPLNWACFGDDIIVHKHAYSMVVRLLGILGFQVNVEKTFSEGPFRESCGHDYYYGHNVRPVFIKTLKTQESRWVAINRLNVWSSNQGVSLRNTIRVLLKDLRRLYVPLHESEDAGLRVPFSLLRKRMNLDHNKSIIYKRSIVRNKYMTFLEGTVRVPKYSKRRHYNNNAALLALLRGDLRDGKMGIRIGNPSYTLRKGITPNWDYTGSTDFSSVGLARLETVITSNLY